MAQTRSSALPDFERFDVSLHPGNELKAFNIWLRRFENRYTVVTTIAATATAAEKEADKRAWLLNYVEDNVLDNFEALYATTELWTASTYSDIIDKYKAQLKPNQTVTLMRHRFYSLCQGSDESFDTFASRVKKEVVYCEFSCDADRSTVARDQIIKGVRLLRIREGALKNDWSLDDLIKNSRRIESANASVTELTSDASYKTDITVKAEPVYKINQAREKRGSRKNSCNNCGMQCEGGEHCFAYGKTCDYCFKPNHFESVCFRKKKNIPPPPKGKPRFKNQNKKPTNFVCMGEDSDSAEEPDNKGNHSISINSVGDKENNHPKTVSVVINNQSLNVLPDSGAKANVLPKYCLPNYLVPHIRPTKSYLSPYKSNPIFPIGKIFMTTNWGNRGYFTKWYVVDTDTLGNNTPLLSCKTSQALGILTINTSPLTVNQ